METRIPPPVVALVLCALAWGADRLLPQARIALPGQGAVAVLLLGLGIASILAGVLAFHAAKTTVNPLHPERATALVVLGIYRHTRNPMYFGLLWVIAAWVVWLGQPAGLLALPAWVSFIERFQILPEEAAMHRLFGASFAAYCQKVRRWI